MDIQDIKLWHWMITGAVVGLILGYAWSIAPQGRDPIMRLPMPPDQFTQQITWSLHSGQPTLRDLVIYPPADNRQYITGEFAQGNGWVPFSLYLRLPFRPDPSSPPTDLREYLEKMQPAASPILAGYLWWDAAWFGPCAGAIAGLVLIGGIWPIILNVLVGAGFGRQRPVKENYNLDRFKGEPAPPPPAAPANEHTQGQLQQLEETLEAKLRETASSLIPVQEISPQQPVKELNAGPLQQSPAPADPDPKEYKGEYYPVAQPPRHDDAKGFSLIELLVVFGIIAILIGLFLPALRRARETSTVLACANNLHQITLAMQMYLNDNQGVYFWRGEDVNTDGMDWYVYGGQQTGNLNLGQDGLFNRFTPRPLNRYVGNVTSVFHCPNDNQAPWTSNPDNGPYPAPSEFAWVGNSYNFNAIGYPFPDPPHPSIGLDGMKTTAISDPTRTILLFDASLFWGYDWHYRHEANIAFADGHVEFLPMPDLSSEYLWNP